MATIPGTTGDDTLTGTTLDDQITGDSGNDTLSGDAGNDTISGGTGNDLVDGGSDNDTLAGDAGSDTLIGGTGNDVVDGGADADNIDGGSGDDTLTGGGGADGIVGGDGNDLIIGDGAGAVGGGGGAAISLANSLTNGLGGSSGFGENQFFRNDDSSTAAIDITSVFGETGLNFFGDSYTSLYVNNNGNLTFGSSLGTFTPTGIGSGFLSPIIAAFWADVDTSSSITVSPTPGGNSTGSNLVHYDLDGVNGVFTATWDDVGYFSSATDKLNAFQIQLFDRGSGDFDIVFRYEDINWTTGNASGGTGGLGGTVARAGYSSGTGISFELAQSGDQSAMLALDATVGNTGAVGVYVFNVRNGNVVLAGNDSLSGGAGNDTIDGGAGNDQLFGDADDDLLIGGAGNDSLDGGLGNDTASYVDSFSGVNVSLAIAGPQNVGVGAGTDTLTGIENLVGSGFADLLTGNSLANDLNGGNGDDTLVGGFANDTLRGGLGNDTASYADFGNAIGVFLADTGPGSFGNVSLGEETDTLVEIETVIGSSFADFFSAGEGNQTLDGGAGIDTIAFTSAIGGVTVDLGNTGAQTIGGNFGVDVLRNFEHAIGGTGDDALTAAGSGSTLEGRGGNDILTGGAGFDWASYAAAGDDTIGGVTASLALFSPQAVGGGDGSDTLVAIDGLIGSNFADTLTGNDGNNSLLGGAGNDLLVGGLGNDVLDGGSNIDRASYAYVAAGGIVVNLANGSGTVNAGIGDLDTLAGIESVLGSAGNDTFNGGAGDQTLDGSSGLDIISYAGASGGINASLGVASAQTIGGGMGVDVLSNFEWLVGGSGDDVLGSTTLSGGSFLEGGAGNDALNGSTAFEWAVYSHATGPVSVSLATPTAQAIGGGQGTDTLSLIDGVIGSDFGDALLGGSGDNSLLGGLGNDQLLGSGGNDYMDGGDGIDFANYQLADGSVIVSLATVAPQTIGGGQGLDTLVNFEGLVGSNSGFGDTLTGNASDNTLIGLGGVDQLTGGGGNDVFVYNASGNDVDSINDFGNGGTSVDRIRVNGVTLAGLVTASNDSGATTPVNGVTLQDFIESFSLFIDTDAAIGAEVEIDLGSGPYALNDFFVSGSDIQFNLAPVAQNDSYGILWNSGPITRNLLANDVDPNSGDVMTLVSVNGGNATTGQGSTVAVVGNQLQYTPGAAIAGMLPGVPAIVDTFAYVVRDVAGKTHTANVTITATNPNLAPTPTADTAVIAEDGPAITVAVTGNDTDPNPEHPGSSLTLTAVGTSSRGATVTISGNSVVYNPNGALNGLKAGEVVTDVISYTIRDPAPSPNTGIASSTLTVTITGANDAPVKGAAIADQQVASEQPFSLTLPANAFTDPDGDTLTLTATRSDGSALPTWLTLNGNVLSGTPGRADAGNLTIRLTATDPTGASATSDFRLAIDRARIENNTAFVTDPNQQVVPEGGQNVDKVITTVDFTLPEGVDQLELQGDARQGTGNSGNNTITGSSGDDTLDGRGGDDTLLGGEGADLLDGGAGSDTLEGGNGNDALFGGEGGDRLEGEGGNNTMAGGGGSDTAVVDGSEDDYTITVEQPAGSAFTLNGLAPGEIVVLTSKSSGRIDRLIGVERVEFTGSQQTVGVNREGLLRNIAPEGVITDQLIDGTTGADSLTGDAGNDIIDGKAGDDTLSGLGGNDTIVGGSGNDSLDGGSGNDVLNGDSGDDVMNGGAGNDSYYVDSTGDQITDSGGRDRIFSVMQTLDLAQYAGIEDAEFFGDGNFTATGNGLANLIVGLAGDDTLNGAGGADVLRGAAGSDTLNGGGGADTMDGGAGDDTYVVDNAADIVIDSGGTDTVATALAGFGLGRLAAIENLVYTGSGAFSGSGNTAANSLAGGGGRDTLSGLGGADQLSGGLGRDTLQGGAGNDTLDGGADDDLIDGGADLDVVLASGNRGDYRFQRLSATATPDVRMVNRLTGETDTLKGVEVIRFLDTSAGNLTADDLLGNASSPFADNFIDRLNAADDYDGLAGNDTIDGAGGDDTLRGGAGNDTIDGGNGDDTLDGGLGNDLLIVDAVGDVVIEGLNQGTDTVRTSLLEYTLGSNVENLAFSGIGSNFSGTGNGLANTLTGGNADDTLSGGGGVDRLVGGGGDDLYLISGAGDALDVIFEAPDGGSDTVRTTLGRYSLALLAQVEHLVFAGADGVAFSGTGNGGANSIVGGSGRDTLAGAGGNDTLLGNAGNDTLQGGGGDDTLAGGDGSDRLDGGLLGDDVALFAGSRDDYSVALVAPGTYELTDGNGNKDVLVGIERAVFDQGTADAADDVSVALDLSETGLAFGNPSYLADTLNGTEGADRIDALAGNDVVDGLGGNDTLLGGAGNDRLTGGAGNDTLTGGAGNDSFVFATAPVSGNDDLITDFALGDRLLLAADAFAGLTAGSLAAANFRAGPGAVAADENDYIVYDRTTGILSYDADGNGSGEAIQIAQLGSTIHPALTVASFTII